MYTAAVSSRPAGLTDASMPLFGPGKNLVWKLDVRAALRPSTMSMTLTSTSELLPTDNLTAASWLLSRGRKDAYEISSAVSSGQPGGVHR